MRSGELHAKGQDEKGAKTRPQTPLHRVWPAQWVPTTLIRTAAAEAVAR
jgi:hypothetical protein